MSINACFSDSNQQASGVHGRNLVFILAQLLIGILSIISFLLFRMIRGFWFGMHADIMSSLHCAVL